MNKFETALNKFSEAHNLNKTYDFKLNETFKNDHKSLKHADVRAYTAEKVEKLLSSIKNPVVNLAVRCALNAGLRKSEILKLSEKNISGNKLEITGKGGKTRVVSQIHDKNLISDVRNFLLENNLSKLGDAVSSAKINNEIRAVLGDSGAIHNLRHNYVITTIKTFEKQGFYKVESVHYSSIEVGHNRNEIIEGVYSK